jgi:hypothetical protein
MSVITHKASDYHFHQGDAGFEAVSRAGPELGAGTGAGDWTPTGVALDFIVSAIVVSRGPILLVWLCTAGMSIL